MENERRLAAECMRVRTKRNAYTNGGKRKYFFGYPKEGGAGYSDCSSACRYAILRASGIDIGSNTDKQLRNGAGVIVHHTTGVFPDESKLKPGDCLYFKGNSNHIKDVGHVEMYTGANECYGHGSGIGPTKKNLNAYCKSRATQKYRYFVAVRWIPDGEDEPMQTKETVQRVYVSAAGRWNFRVKPSVLSKSYGTMVQGTVMEYVGIQDEGVAGKWVQVKFGSTVGWISAKAVKRVR